MKLLGKIFTSTAALTLGAGMALAQTPAPDLSVCVPDTAESINQGDLDGLIDLVHAIDPAVEVETYGIEIPAGETVGNASAGFSFATLTKHRKSGDDSMSVMIDNNSKIGCDITRETFDRFKPAAPQP